MTAAKVGGIPLRNQGVTFLPVYVAWAVQGVMVAVIPMQ
jgi:hypothetical protein